LARVRDSAAVRGKATLPRALAGTGGKVKKAPSEGG